METEYLHTRFSVGIVGSFEPQLCDAQFPEEFIDSSHKVSKGQSIVGNHSFYLVELGQVCGVGTFISENSIYWEVLHRVEFFLQNIIW